MLDDATFHRVASATLTTFSDKIEDADADGHMECELNEGVLSIKNNAGKTWIVSKHAPSKQLWLASSISGGLHFLYVDEQWQLADGRILSSLLSAELRAHAALEVSL